MIKTGSLQQQQRGFYLVFVCLLVGAQSRASVIGLVLQTEETQVRKSSYKQVWVASFVEESIGVGA